MNELSCDIINRGLYQKTKHFVQHALTFLEPRTGTEIIEFIERKPETERNRFYRLLHPQPEFYGLILNYEENLKQFPEFSDYDRIMHEDFVLEEKVKTIQKSSAVLETPYESEELEVESAKKILRDVLNELYSEK